MTRSVIRHDAITDAALRAHLRDGSLTLAGNRRLKIYGRLDCRAGRRMARGTRVFFANHAAAEDVGYRPCAHCLPAAYDVWKSTVNSGILTRCGPVAHQDRATDS
jgi:methylphosphotriester-DNA--protein-cysteine methyltransferase